ncbi:hypothetical protein Syun_003542 [Stephania yunnanensis]|uniref:Uncharacterized protein n=1 Tax=Stephania yunnanensis TaxID=152371 RepID=A0AAP0Q0P5_9MAGN
MRETKRVLLLVTLNCTTNPKDPFSECPTSFHLVRPKPTPTPRLEPHRVPTTGRTDPFSLKHPLPFHLMTTSDKFSVPPVQQEYRKVSFPNPNASRKSITRNRGNIVQQ